MKTPAILAIVLILGLPISVPAGQERDRNPPPLGSGPPIYPMSPEMRSRLKMPIRLPQTPAPSQRDHHRPGPPDHRHGYGAWGTVWPATGTVVREVQPIIIVNQPPASPPEPAPTATPAPAPEPDKVWVPPVTETRTVPGYWDYAIKKTWMGDYWRFEQDFGDKTWVPESQVTVVTQEGYWKTVE